MEGKSHMHKRTKLSHFALKKFPSSCSPIQAEKVHQFSVFLSKTKPLLQFWWALGKYTADTQNTDVDMLFSLSMSIFTLDQVEMNTIYEILAKEETILVWNESKMV